MDNLEPAPGHPAIGGKNTKNGYVSIQITFFCKIIDNNILIYLGKVQIWMSNYDMPSCKSKYRFVIVMIPMEAGSGQKMVQVGRSYSGMPSCVSKYRFVMVRISIYTFK